MVGREGDDGGRDFTGGGARKQKQSQEVEDPESLTSAQ